MELKPLDHQLTVCKVASLQDVCLDDNFFFISKTDEELSLVCLTEHVPPLTLAREDGWRAFRIQGVLDFSLIGVLSRLCGVLAQHGIGVFAVSTYNTDYILVREEHFAHALAALSDAGYTVADT